MTTPVHSTKTTGSRGIQAWIPIERGRYDYSDTSAWVEKLSKAVLEAYDLWNRRVSTPDLNRWLQEAMARGGKVVLISDAEGIAQAGENTIATIEMPQVHPLIAPLVYAVPVQLLAYHVAVARGTDVDQPRNLAKSVTVE